MTTTVPLSALVATKGNPRRSYDKQSIEGLAQSIKKDGLIHNLTVRPLPGGKYRVVAGQRRFLALQHLKSKGEIKRSYKVPVQVKKTVSTRDLNRLATVENVQREALDPIDEAESFAKLLVGGARVEDMSVETGVSAQTIQRRLALANLAPEAKAAVRNKTLSLSVAEALTLGTSAQQKAWLKSIKRGSGIDARSLRSLLLEEKPSAAIAIFPVGKYRGTYTRDLFAEKDATYFDDREQFGALQREAVEELAEKHRKGFAWVEIVTEHTVPWWQYRDARKKELGGVIIHLSPTGRVEVRKNLIRQEVDPSATNGSGRTKKAIQKLAVSKATYRYANAHKTLAVQMALLGNARKAKEVTAALLLTAGSRIKLSVHDALREVARHPDSSKAYAVIDKMAAELLQALGIGQEQETTPAWLRLIRSDVDWKDLALGLKSLSEAQLDRLIAFVPILCFGTDRIESQEPEGTPFSEVAKEVLVSMRDVWTPDDVFLAGLKRDDLVKIATSCGALRKQPRLSAATKKELVASLASHFKQTAESAVELDEAGAKAKNWLPTVMSIHADTTRTSKAA